MNEPIKIHPRDAYELICKRLDILECFTIPWHKRLVYKLLGTPIDSAAFIIDGQVYIQDTTVMPASQAPLGFVDLNANK